MSIKEAGLPFLTRNSPQSMSLSLIRVLQPCLFNIAQDWHAAGAGSVAVEISLVT